MAGWSIVTNGSVVDCGENIGAYENNGVTPHSSRNSDGVGVDDDESDDYNVRPRCYFDQVLSVFLKDIEETGILRPVPPMLGGGKEVDLFKLFRLVRERGGYDRVSKKRLWAFVAKESGFSRDATAAVKLIYFKYLNELEKWFWERCRDRGLGNGQCGFDENFQLLSLELETEFRCLLSDGWHRKEEDGRFVHLESDSSEKTELCLWDTKDAYSGFGKCHSGNDEKFKHDHYEGHQTLNLNDNKKGREWKRKRESLSGMLKWLIQIAKHPLDPLAGSIPKPSQWKEHQGNEFWIQAIRLRNALLLRRHINSKTEESSLQKKLKMHPSMYEDNSRHHYAERLRCSGRVHNSSRVCSCCNSCSAGQSKLMSPSELELEKDLKEQTPEEVYLSAPDIEVSQPKDEALQGHVSVGPLFQADVPEWTGVVSESDPKWLGTRVWPMDCGEHKSTMEIDSIGQGRPDLCGCSCPGSVPCVRFHIAEARMKLKCQLGSVFYQWRFDRMGEEVSLQWTAEEEKRFKDMVRSAIHSHNNEVFKWFPMKTRENLVSYYFNVFLIQRRSYQNRVTPKDIDSDDDETEVGSLSEGFGLDALKVSSYEYLSCSKNKQCIDLDLT